MPKNILVRTARRRSVKLPTPEELGPKANPDHNYAQFSVHEYVPLPRKLCCSLAWSLKSTIRARTVQPQVSAHLVVWQEVGAVFPPESPRAEPFNYTNNEKSCAQKHWGVENSHPATVQNPLFLLV